MPKLDETKWALGTLVEIEWVDSASSDDGWVSIEKAKKDTGPSICRTVGYVLWENADALTVVQSQAFTTDHVLKDMSIPKGCIRDVLMLKGMPNVQPQEEEHADKRD